MGRHRDTQIRAEGMGGHAERCLHRRDMEMRERERERETQREGDRERQRERKCRGRLRKRGRNPEKQRAEMDRFRERLTCTQRHTIRQKF